ncbi:hypothetical protein ABT120_36935 [Nonomuraea angiospora]|uniref:hypothetical protein n=1 Tax=Nonomuraea angiospora TaxID=46172 RepID=UPI00332300D9
MIAIGVVATVARVGDLHAGNQFAYREARGSHAAAGDSCSPSGLSAYVAAAVARQIERDNLNELIQVAEAEHGPITDDEVQALRDQLHQARRGQTNGGTAA